ncbi:bifunctional folylpolyglutamate synthase/dihydrofolate synthase [Moraxella nasovis]|uniref:bifunctional folylpolyglutamate synthase/dihydrofolate synthase n=1 Tax=Moraxella nasovis TaxID=2904121 RepID=UPI001F612152|nr:folylpolyglutamate synthase/dihydrofolate synthase family protein [Moraxella nasovis]UNU72886.1 bifunctional folylpolyglutamate synthase/dihydrofolate synthase [Moraxella nasovis]
MTTTRTLSQWLDYMASIHVSAIDMGLQRVLPVAKHLGILKENLDPKPYIFTVAGTNGKGSTTATIAQICQAAELKTALYQSPHLVSFTERVKINGVEVDEDTLTCAFEKVEQARIQCGLSLSFFEMTTLASFVIFKQANCDVWVLEIGLGGRLDVVNIIDPDVAVITNIGIDHTDWLGSDIQNIAEEKAGIIRHGIPVVIGADVPSRVHDIAMQNAATVYQLGQDYDYHHDGLSDVWQYACGSRTLNLPMPKLSVQNAATAISSVLVSNLAINEKHIAQAMRQVQLAGRFDRRMIKNRQWLFDVAHNEHGMTFFLSQFIPYWRDYQHTHPDARLHIIFSMLGDKDVAKVLDLMQAHIHGGDFRVDTWHTAAILHNRAMPLQNVLKLMDTHLTDANIVSYATLSDAATGVIQATCEQDLILCFGSFHTIGETLMALLDIRFNEN